MGKPLGTAVWNIDFESCNTNIEPKRKRQLSITSFHL